VQFKILPAQEELMVGAENAQQYLDLLKGKKVACVVNQSSTVQQQHLVDFLLAHQVDVIKIFAPEHGFRGEAGAGEKIEDGKDSKTGLPVISLYGQNKKH
jgi:uncharacterized protein YbbC (DUF1343 family)